MKKWGYDTKARKILISKKDHELHLANGERWFGLFLSKLFISYGYNNFKAVYWLLGFLGGGWLLMGFYLSPGPRKPIWRFIYMDLIIRRFFWRLIFSLDLLLPIIQVKRKAESSRGIAKIFEAKSFKRLSLAFSSLAAAAILVFFILAGLSGLTK